MTMKPTIHVTNWPSRNLHGPGRSYTIMALPRHWEHGCGSVSLLTPHPLALADVRSGAQSIGAYREAYQDDLRRHAHLLVPGELRAVSELGIYRVADGDTICCACSRDKAAAGECHRVWAAEFLVRAGWNVVLDGEELPCAS